MEIRGFYNQFKSVFLRDLARGNRRLFAQREFLRITLPANIDSVLIVGSGIGDLVPFLLKTRKSLTRIVCVDISDESLEVGRRLFGSPRVEFFNLDVTMNSYPDGFFDVVIFPDSYEHMPPDSREMLAKNTAASLTEGGSIYMTVPSVAHQNMLRTRGTGLQPIDEDITVEDFLAFGRWSGCQMVYVNHVSVFRRHDYVHAVMQRKLVEIEPLHASSLCVAESAGVRNLGLSRWLLRSALYNPLTAQVRSKMITHKLRGASNRQSASIED